MKEEKKINSSEILTIAEGLKLEYDYLDFITAIDYKDRDTIEMVYHFRAIGNSKNLFLKSEISRTKPEIRSISHLWPAANWHEREVFDLFGVNFIDHPDLRRILLTPEWVGHPLLKDYEQATMVKRPETV